MGAIAALHDHHATNPRAAINVPELSIEDCVQAVCNTFGNLLTIGQLLARITGIHGALLRLFGYECSVLIFFLADRAKWIVCRRNPWTVQVRSLGSADLGLVTLNNTHPTRFVGLNIFIIFSLRPRSERRKPITMFILKGGCLRAQLRVQ